MTQQGDAVAGELATEKVGIKGYLAFFLTIIFFSGITFSTTVITTFGTYCFASTANSLIDPEQLNLF